MALVHGWGAGRHVWDPIRAGGHLAAEVHCPDLPGHGATASAPVTGALDDWTDDVLARIAPREFDWVGWSLGGLLGLRALARAPGRVARVVLLAATPRFIAAAGWPGVEDMVFADFRAGLGADPAAALERFRGLQVAGGEHARAGLRALRAAAARDGAASGAALAAGLDILRTHDLRGDFASRAGSIHAILGDRDPLIPTRATAAMAEHGVAARVVPGAAHAPMASHPRATAAAIAGELTGGVAD